MWQFLKKLEIELPYYPAIPLLGIHTEETRIERDTCLHSLPSLIRQINSILLCMTGNLKTINAGEGVEKREPSYTVGGNAN